MVHTPCHCVLQKWAIPNCLIHAPACSLCKNGTGYSMPHDVWDANGHAFKPADVSTTAFYRVEVSLKSLGEATDRSF